MVALALIGGAEGATDRVTTWCLSNGTTVAYLYDPNRTEVAVATALRGGRGAEPSGAAGVAHLAEHVWFEAPVVDGVRVIDALVSLGAVANATTSAEHWTFVTVAPATALADVLAVEALRTTAAFDALGPDVIAVERAVLQTELAGTTVARALRAPIVSALFGAASEPDVLPAFERADLQSIAAHWVPDARSIAILGALEEDAVLTAVRAALDPGGSLPSSGPCTSPMPAPAVQAAPPTSLRQTSAPIGQPALVLGWIVPEGGRVADRVAAAMGTALGEPLGAPALCAALDDEAAATITCVAGLAAEARTEAILRRGLARVARQTVDAVLALPTPAQPPADLLSFDGPAARAAVALSRTGDATRREHPGSDRAAWRRATDRRGMAWQFLLPDAIAMGASSPPTARDVSPRSLPSAPQPMASAGPATWTEPNGVLSAWHPYAHGGSAVVGVSVPEPSVERVLAAIGSFQPGGADARVDAFPEADRLFLLASAQGAGTAAEAAAAVLADLPPAGVAVVVGGDTSELEARNASATVAAALQGVPAEASLPSEGPGVWIRPTDWAATADLTWRCPIDPRAAYAPHGQRLASEVLHRTLRRERGLAYGVSVEVGDRHLVARTEVRVEQVPAALAAWDDALFGLTRPTQGEVWAGASDVLAGSIPTSAGHAARLSARALVAGPLDPRRVAATGPEDIAAWIAPCVGAVRVEISGPRDPVERALRGAEVRVDGLVSPDPWVARP